MLNNFCVIDLFAGVGGFSLGAARAGLRVALAVDIDKHAIEAHDKNFPSTNHIDSDIQSCSPRSLKQSAAISEGDVFGVIGGPPCQGFSSIGKRNIVDPRNSLFERFFELCSELKPAFFVAENVLGILDEKYSAVRARALLHVTSDYVMIEPFVLNALDFGAPTSRRRVFFVGYRHEYFRPIAQDAFLKNKVAEHVTVRDALRGLPTTISSDWQTESQGWRKVKRLPDSPFWNRVSNHVPENVGNHHAIRQLTEFQMVSGCLGTRHEENVVSRIALLRPGQQDRVSKCVRLDPNGFCPTLRAGTGPEKGSYQAIRPIHPTENRVITPREAARLQGFPDWFVFAPTKWHSFRQIGNSVSPLLAEAVLRTITDHFRRK